MVALGPVLDPIKAVLGAVETAVPVAVKADRFGSTRCRAATTEMLALVMTDNSTKIVTLGAKVLGRVGVFAWFSFACLYLYYGFSRPTFQQPDSGRLYPLDTHGHVAYLTLREINNLYHLRDAAFVLVLVAVGMVLVIKVRERRRAQSQ